MKPRIGKIFAAMIVLGGVALVLLEARRLRVEETFGGWFWLVVGVLAIIFGMVELLAPGRPKNGGS